MYIKQLLFVFVLLVATMSTSCGNSTADNLKPAKNLIIPKDSIKPVGIFNDLSKYLGGMPIEESSELFKYTKIKHWKNYCKESDTVWGTFRIKTLNKVVDWAKTEIPNINEQYKTIFYPFSGPDYLYVSNLFPKATKYIMFGLEAAGMPPDPKALFMDSAKIFNEIDTTIHDALSLSYFRTIDMAHDLVNKNINGTLPVMLLFIARTNNTVLNVKPVEINAKGEIAYLPEFKRENLINKVNKGVEITLFDNKTKLEKQVYYFSADISDAGLAANKNCKLFFQKLDTTLITYLKSASFLMHREKFTTIRNTVLNKSLTILQDDSGVRFKFYDRKKWDIQLYGVYTKPLDLFKGFIEYDLIKAYKEENPKPLNFTIGYLTDSNMLLAKKKGKK